MRLRKWTSVFISSTFLIYFLAGCSEYSETDADTRKESEYVFEQENSKVEFGFSDTKLDLDIDSEKSNAVSDIKEDCVPNCKDRECGPDGCDGICEPGCGEYSLCDESPGLCVSVPS